MAIVKCINNHYYDNENYKSCPYCAKESELFTPEDDMNEQKTSFMYSDIYDDDDEGQITEAYGDSVSEFDKTIGIFDDYAQNRLTVGWIVCVKGVGKGISYPIYSGRNMAGRSIDMDIVLADDMMITRENHFSIVYDPKTICFFVVPGAGYVYLNDGELIKEAVILTDGDKLTVGNSDYIFIQFCREGREWT